MFNKKYIASELNERNHVVFTRFGIGIFDERWLDFRLSIFETLTLPSVVSQNCKKVIWFLFVDSDAPESFVSRLSSLVMKYDFIKIVKVDFYFNYFDAATDICKEVMSNFGSVFVSKIDDDDLIHQDFFSFFYEAAQDRERNCVYTFPQGYEFLLQERVVLKCERPFLTHNTFFKISDVEHLKLLVVGHHKIERYCFGSKVKINKVVAKEPVYLYVRHKQSDSNFSSVKKEILADARSRLITLRIYEKFSINRDDYLKLRSLCSSYPSSPKQKTWDVNKELNKEAKVIYNELRKVKRNMIENGSEVL